MNKQHLILLSALAQHSHYNVTKLLIRLRQTSSSPYQRILSIPVETIGNHSQCRYQ